MFEHLFHALILAGLVAIRRMTIKKDRWNFQMPTALGQNY